MRSSIKRSLAGVAVLVVAGGSAIVATSGTADEPPAVRPAAPLPDVVERVMDDPRGFQGNHGIDTSKAQRVELPDGASGELWVTPGADGAVCISRTDGGTACGTAEEIAQGRLTLAVLPPVQGALPMQVPSRMRDGAGAGSEPKPAPVVTRREPGRGIYLGYVNDDVTRASLIDANGKTLASSAVANNVYEITIDNVAISAPVTLQLERRNGPPLTVGGY